MTAPDKIWHEIVTAKDMDELYGFGISPDDWNAANFEEYTRTSIAQAAVAAAYEAAAQVVLGSNLGLDISDIADDVRALATPDQIAALAAVRAATVTVKPLEWVKDTMPNAAPQRYRAATHDGTGDYSVSGSKNSDAWQWFRNGYFVDGHQHHKPMPLDAAKAAAKADYDARIRSAITITRGDAPDTIAKSDDFVSLPRAEVEALMEAASDAASELASIRHHIAAAIVKKALATLQERMK